ncbi:MAG TPA: glutamyl-tRNA reductase [Bacillota bacterium]
MHVVVVGMNHRTAPIEVRERLALTDEARQAFSGSVGALASVDEHAILSTCNRLEVYAVVTRYHEALEHLVDLMARRADMRSDTLLSYLYNFHHHQAARHLFRVACGLDSMILGETQILGQVRDAYQAAQRDGTVGTVLHELFQRALRLGKRVHSESGLSRHAASVSSAAVELARRRLGDLKGRTVLVIGAGDMAELAADILHGQGAAVLVANRTAGRAEELAARFEGAAVALAELPQALARADIAIVSTAAPGHLLTAETVALAAAGRRSPLLLIDISMPRNIEPAAGQVPGVSLYHIDDLQAVVEENLRRREQEIPGVEAMVQDEVAGFSRWFEELYVVPLIRSLRLYAEEIRREEVDRLLARMPELDARQRRLVEAATASMVKRLLNEPTVRLRRYAGRDEAEMYVQALGDLFNLPGFERGPDGADAGAEGP